MVLYFWSQQKPKFMLQLSLNRNQGVSLSKDREFIKTQNLIFESPAKQGFQKLKTRF
jgi:hypothetical protein